MLGKVVVKGWSHLFNRVSIDNDLWTILSARTQVTNWGRTSRVTVVKCLTAEQEVVGSNPGVGPILRVLKQLGNEGSAFALQMARLSCGLDDHVKWRFFLHKET